MKYRDGEIEVEGTPEEIYEFLRHKLGKRAERKETKEAKDVDWSAVAKKAWKTKHKRMRKAKRVTVRRHTQTDYSQFFGGKSLRDIMRERDLYAKPLDEALEVLHIAGLPRTSKRLIKRVKANYWVNRASARKARQWQ